MENYRQSLNYWNAETCCFRTIPQEEVKALILNFNIENAKLIKLNKQTVQQISRLVEVLNLNWSYVICQVKVPHYS